MSRAALRAKLAIGLTLVFVACSPANEGLVEPGADKAKVEAAMVEAAKSLPQFWDKVDARQSGASDFRVKLAMPAEQGMEYIWANPLSHSQTEVVATLTNDPVHITGVRYGSRVTVRPDAVVDWAYEKNGKLYGHYTTRALMGQMSADERAEVEPLLALTPVEPTAP